MESSPDGQFSLPAAQGTNLVLAAAAKGYFTGAVVVSTPASDVIVALDAVPPGDDSTYALVEPTTCGQCHPNQMTQWTGSPMHRAGTNTWLYDLYDGTGTAGGMGGWVYVRDSEHAPANLASECASCHQPEPWVAAPFSPLEPIGSLSPAALHGVSCDVCHKIAHIDETKTNFPGIYPGVVTLTRPQGPTYDQVQYGLLGDATFTRPNRMRASYQPQLEAAVCAACHQDKNDPDQDGDFEEPNGVVSEPTYLEWLASPYGDPLSPLYASCVDCHMPASGATTVCNVLVPPLLRDPPTIRHHTIEGTTAAFLENAATLTLDCQAGGGTLTARAIVTNDRTGHHLPTGVTIRNVILRIDAWREEDGALLAHTGAQTIHTLGGVGDPAQGFLSGQPGKLYAKFNHDADGHGPVFFTEATGIEWDNRIPALAADTTSYSFAVPPGGGTLRVRARLIYRRSVQAITAAKGWTLDGHGNPLADVQPPHFGHLMEETTWSELVTAAGDPAPEDSHSFGWLRCVPNPAQGSATIHFVLARPASARIRIYDLAGRRVALLTEGYHSAGTHAVEWLGRDAANRRLPSGVYWLRLETGTATRTERIVLLR